MRVAEVVYLFITIETECDDRSAKEIAQGCVKNRVFNWKMLLRNKIK